MKYKKLVIILSTIIGSILLLTILAFTLFKPQSVKLHFKNETTKFSEQTQNEIVFTSGIKSASSAFALNKKNISNNLEVQYPYLKVINIEVVFPNTVIIHCAEREETFAIKIGDSGFFICDSEFKVLKLSSSSDGIVELKGIEIINKTARAGEFLQFENAEIAKNFTLAMIYNNKTITDAKAMFVSVEYITSLEYVLKGNEYTKNVEVSLLLTTKDGFKIRINHTNENLISKVNLALNEIPIAYEYYNSKMLVIDTDLNNSQQISKQYIDLN